MAERRTIEPPRKNQAPLTSGHRQRSKPARRQRRFDSLELEFLEGRCLPSAYGQLPLSFEANQGQVDSRVNFLSRGSDYTLFLTPSDAVLTLQHQPSLGQAAVQDVICMRLLGAGTPQVHALDQLPGVANYLIGNDPANWHVNIPTYAQVEYQNVYAGIDLLYHGSSQQQLEYDLVVNPGASPGSIRLAVEGVRSMGLDGHGNLVLHLGGGDVVEQAPAVYQIVDGVKQTVAGRYVIRDGHTVGFAIGAYDASKPLTIDPVLSYSTYLGGSQADAAAGIAVDGSGNAYVTGSTTSADFPTAGTPVQASSHGSSDAFVAKLNPQGTGLVYSTYLGGSGADVANGIAVDTNLNVYVTGATTSTDFPTVNPTQAHHAADGGQNDAFVAKLDSLGSALTYSTYLGGTGDDVGTAIAVDSSFNAYITGATSSSDFPVASPLFAHTAGGAHDAFVTKLNPQGNAPVYSTYLGGSGDEQGTGIAVDSAGNAYVAGWTTSSNFPTLTALQAAHAADAGAADGFVTKLNATGSGLDYSTYLGGGGDDRLLGIAVDGSGAAYVTGRTTSTDFPTASPFQATLKGAQDALVAKLVPAGNALAYSSYLGGSGSDQGNAIAVDVSGNAYVTGSTTSSDFPIANALQAQPAPGSVTSAFVTKVGSSGTGLAYSTYLGGSGSQSGAAIAVDVRGNAYVAGVTSSSNFPTTGGVLQTSNHGGTDAFVTKITHLFDAVDVAAGSDNKTRLLWGATDGRVSTWTVDNSFAINAGPAYGIFAGWTPVATAAGNNVIYVLWDNVNGAAALWQEDGSGNFVKAGFFGPIGNWKAEDIALGTDGNIRLLWSNIPLMPRGSSQFSVWTVDSSFNGTPGPVSPASSLIAFRIAAAPDGTFRVLGGSTTPAATEVWVVNGAGAIQNFAAVPGNVFAVDVAAGPANQTYVLQRDNSGAAFIVVLNTALQPTMTFVYGALAGYTPQALDVGSDGFLHLLWDNLDGTAGLWLVNASGAVQGAEAYGPF